MKTRRYKLCPQFIVLALVFLLLTPLQMLAQGPTIDFVNMPQMAITPQKHYFDAHVTAGNNKGKASNKVLIFSNPKVAKALDLDYMATFNIVGTNPIQIDSTWEALNHLYRPVKNKAGQYVAWQSSTKLVDYPPTENNGTPLTPQEQAQLRAILPHALSMNASPFATKDTIEVQMIIVDSATRGTGGASNIYDYTQIFATSPKYTIYTDNMGDARVTPPAPLAKLTCSWQDFNTTTHLTTAAQGPNMRIKFSFSGLSNLDGKLEIAYKNPDNTYTTLPLVNGIAYLGDSINGIPFVNGQVLTFGIRSKSITSSSNVSYSAAFVSVLTDNILLPVFSGTINIDPVPSAGDIISTNSGVITCKNTSAILAAKTKTGFTPTWYRSTDLTTPILDGDTLITGTLVENTTFYVAAKNDLGCIAPVAEYVPVVAQVVYCAPTLTIINLPQTPISCAQMGFDTRIDAGSLKDTMSNKVLHFEDPKLARSLQLTYLSNYNPLVNPPIEVWDTMNFLDRPIKSRPGEYIAWQKATELDDYPPKNIPAEQLVFLPPATLKVSATPFATKDTVRFYLKIVDSSAHGSGSGVNGNYNYKEVYSTNAPKYTVFLNNMANAAATPITIPSDINCQWKSFSTTSTITSSCESPKVRVKFAFNKIVDNNVLLEYDSNGVYKTVPVKNGIAYIGDSINGVPFANAKAWNFRIKSTTKTTPLENIDYSVNFVSVLTDKTVVPVSSGSITKISTIPVAGTISGNNNVCQGSTVTLTTTATGGTWESSNPSIATVTSGVVAGITPGNAEIRYLVNNGTCTDTSKFALTVNTKPEISFSTPNKPCAPNTVNLKTLSGTGLSGLTFTYFTDAACTSAVPAPENVNATGTYYIVGKTTSACTDTANVAVTIKPQPYFLFGDPCSSPANLTTLKLTDGDTTGLSFAYFTDPACTSPTSPIVSTGTYYITGTNGTTGCSDTVSVVVGRSTDSVYLTLAPNTEVSCKPISFKAILNSCGSTFTQGHVKIPTASISSVDVIYNGSSLTFDGSGNALFGGSFSLKDTVFNFTIASKTVSSENLTLELGFNSADTTTVNINLTGKPEFKFADTNNCGGPVDLAGLRLESGSITGLTLSYHDINSNLLASSIVSNSAPYIVIGTNAGGCGSSDTVDVKVTLALPTIAAAQTSISTCSANAGTIKLDSVFGITATNGTAKFYSDINLAFEITDPSSYQLAKGSNIVYTASVNGNGCKSNVITLTYKWDTLPNKEEIVITSPVNTCYGTSTVLAATPNAGFATIWYADAGFQNKLFEGNSFTTPELTTETMYYAAAKNISTGCTSADGNDVTVRVNALPTVQILVSDKDTSVCSNTDFSFSMNNLAQTPDGDSLQFCENTDFSRLLPNSYIVGVNQTKTVYVRAFNNGTRCQGTQIDSVTLTVTGAPVIVADPQGGAYGSVSSLSIETSNATSYNWYKDNTLFATTTIPSVAVRNAGSYYAEAIGECGTTISNVAEITKAILTVTVANDSVAEGFDPATYAGTLTITGFISPDTQDSLNTVPVISILNTITSETAAGVYANSILASGGDDDSYDFNYVYGTLTIVGVDLSVKNISVDGKDAQTEDGREYVINAQCNANAVLIKVDADPFAIVKINGIVGDSLNYTMGKYGRNIVPVEISDLKGNVETYEISIFKPIPSEQLFIKHWSDVVSVPATFQGIAFEKVEWYYHTDENDSEGTKVERDVLKGYLQTTTAGYYSVIINDTLTSCPVQITTTDINTKVYPNPVRKSQSFILESGLNDDEWKNASFSIVDLKGNILKTEALTGSRMEINSPSLSGTYVIRLDAHNGSRIVKFIVN